MPGQKEEREHPLLKRSVLYLCKLLACCPTGHKYSKNQGQSVKKEFTQSIAFCKENCSASVTFLQHSAQTNSVFIRVETGNERVEKSIFICSDVGAAKLVGNYFQPEIRSKKCLNSHPRKLLRYFISAGRKDRRR